MTRLRGAVTEWNDEAGYGTITATDGGTYFLHCTAIADGTRTIAADAPVSFTAAPGSLGRWEARQVVPEAR